MARKKSSRMVFRPLEPGLEKMLGTLESQVMQVIWDAEGPRTVQEVRDEIATRGKDAAYTTIMTTLGRLHAKGLLRRETRGKAYHYAPQVSRRELTDTMARQVVSGLVGSFAEPAIAYFVEALEKEAPEKLDTLAELLERKRAERKEH